MLPTQLTAAQFAAYPAQARQLSQTRVGLLRQLPLPFLASLLREVIEYDFAFPAERKRMEQQLTLLASLSSSQLSQWLNGFNALKIEPALANIDWVNQPAHFTEDFSAYLWSSNQMDAFRAAALSYNDRLAAALPPPSASAQRLGVAVIGQGVSSYKEALFTNLRKHGTYFNRVEPRDGLPQLLDVLAQRSRSNPDPYAHWYVDGGLAAPHDTALTTVSYEALSSARAMLLKHIEVEVGKPGMGPEQLRTSMMRMSPADLHMHSEAVLDRFQMKLLTEGSGTQIFSTTFTQWAAREILRRAQPLSLLVRYAPRQRQRPMNEMLSAAEGEQQLDPAGSLVDGDMGAYYQWIDQQRLPQSNSSFIAWFEGHSVAVGIGPSLPRGVESDSRVDLKSLVKLASS